MAALFSSPGRAFCSLSVCYLLLLLLGALLFQLLELPLEKRLQQQARELRRSFLQENSCVQESRLEELLARCLAAQHADVPVLEGDEEPRQWSFTSSLYFVILSLTTTGADSYSPRSDEAKFFLIFYCALGIPLTLLILTLLSHLLHPMVTLAPLHFLRSLCALSLAQSALVHFALLSVAVLVLLLFLPALLVWTQRPQWSYLDSLFFCFLTLSTVGPGRNSPGGDYGAAGENGVKLLSAGYLLVGLVVLLTLKETALQVPQVRALVRLLCGSQQVELKGFNLNELTSEEQEEDRQYTSSICTISSELRSSGSAFPASSRD
ncbi:potassium channel, subfamily K, member 7 [Neosynchiropus ocellatus]